MTLLPSNATLSLRADSGPLFMKTSTLLSLAIVVLWLLRRTSHSKAGNTIPPGPKGLPLLGEYHLLLNVSFTSSNGFFQAYFLTCGSIPNSACTAGPRPTAPYIRSPSATSALSSSQILTSSKTSSSPTAPYSPRARSFTSRSKPSSSIAVLPRAGTTRHGT